MDLLQKLGCFTAIIFICYSYGLLFKPMLNFIENKGLMTFVLGAIGYSLATSVIIVTSLLFQLQFKTVVLGVTLLGITLLLLQIRLTWRTKFFLKGEGSDLGTLAIASLFFLPLIYLCSLGALYDIPGICIWGLKAKVIYLSQSLSTMLLEPSLKNAQMSYPLGFSVLMAWFYQLNGNVDDQTIRYIPSFLLFILAWLLLVFLKKAHIPKLLSGLIVLGIFLNVGMLTIGLQLYAESIFLIQVTLSLLLLFYYHDTQEDKYLILAFVFALFTCLTKNEGGIYAVSFVLSLLVYGKRTSFLKGGVKSLWILTSLVLMLLLFWRVVILNYHLVNEDFVSFDQISLLRLVNVIEAFEKALWILCFRVDLSGPGFWILLFVLFVYGFRAVDRLGRFFLTLVFTYLLICCCTFIYSSGSMEWHLRAMDRLMLFPGILLLLVAVRAVYPNGYGFSSVKNSWQKPALTILLMASTGFNGFFVLQEMQREKSFVEDYEKTFHKPITGDVWHKDFVDMALVAITLAKSVYFWYPKKGFDRKSVGNMLLEAEYYCYPNEVLPYSSEDQNKSVLIIPKNCQTQFSKTHNMENLEIIRENKLYLLYKNRTSIER